MLQIKGIHKQYTTGDLIQDALDGVSLNFRDNEFVSVLGPSGSGKTTLLNIVGGLDRYDSGDLIINGISTKQYKDKDWDSYRNHTIGFVFQSYNLIPHQSILANVELALTISGASKSERRKRAKNALEQVGLGDQIHKRPNQMSGGQMQRVAIARALINNPDILLADEPTGALDTETSAQVMELLKEVAKDKLVIMVTHNPELAQEHSTRIVKLRDGKIVDDSDPYEIVDEKPAEHKNMGKASMSLFTSLSLSFNNLRTKKGRTLLTSFAGSIGIIGIALILALSTGVNIYIDDIQKDTMTSYPITIESETIDLTGVMNGGGMNGMMRNSDEDVGHELDAVYSNGSDLESVNSMNTSITENNLTEFKKYLDDPNSEIHQYVGENSIIYSYDVAFDVYAYDPDKTLVNTNGSTFSDDNSSSGSGRGGMSSVMNSFASSETFSELLPGSGDDLVSAVVMDSYDVVHGAWPKSYDEIVIVLNENNEISLTTLYSLGLLPADEYDELMDAVENDEDFTAKQYNWSYEEILNKTFYMVPACDYYTKNDGGTFDYAADDDKALEELAQSGLKLKVSGVIRPLKDAANANISGAAGYTTALTNYIIDYANKSDVVIAQKDSPDVNVINNMTFEPDSDEEKISDAKEYYESLGVSDKAALWASIVGTVYANEPERLQAMQNMDEIALASMSDEYFENADSETLLSIYDNYISPGSYSDNMTAFGYVSLDAPSSISIYADSFEDKDSISASIENYNASAKSENKITYTDFVKVLMSSVTTIINVISYVLIAFVAVSLVVSSIMIGIITYISVLERTKEIGILRAIGASKRNISQVFNAETFIVGLCAGLIGVGISYLLLIPGNAVIHMLTGSSDVNAALPVASALVLIVISVILTLIGGYIPSKKAAKKDPVAALRTE